MTGAFRQHAERSGQEAPVRSDCQFLCIDSYQHQHAAIELNDFTILLSRSLAGWSDRSSSAHPAFP